MSSQKKVSAADAAAIASVLSMSAAVMGGVGEPANDFFPGDFVQGNPDGVVIAGDLEDRGCGYGYGKGGGDCPGPDTVLGVYDDLGSIVETDDDDSFLGNGRASGVFGRPVEPSGLVSWLVSGYDDFDFDGFDDGTANPHGELGLWNGWVDWYDGGFNYIGFDYVGDFEFITGDEVFGGGLTAPAEAIGGYYDLYLDNTPGGCKCSNDVDFYQIGGLAPDTEYEIRVTSADFDTVLATFDSGGAFIDINDDDPDVGCCLSVLNGTTDEFGDLFIAITGYSDFAFAGFHFQFGNYEITITNAAPGCNEADLAPEYGLLDLADITAFVSGFTSQDSSVDFNDDGLFDLADITTFVNAFLNGCP